MKSGWSFKKLDIGGNNREPIHGEFFAAEGISDPGMALVREAIQNALDAGNPTQTVLVRVFLSGENDSQSADAVTRWFGDTAWAHLNAEDNGLRRDELPSKESNCTFLVFEDFGTSGLTGDPAQAFRDRTGKKNHFYHFFRAEGQTDKDSSNRGSWGVGKHVFWRSSRVSSAFAVTVSATDTGHRRLMMGKTVLKSHGIGDEKDARYQDGYFGMLPTADQLLPMPISDDSEITQFCKQFNLERGTEPGLSVVVPWPDKDITDREIICGVAKHYFYPILTGQLEVIVKTPTKSATLDSQSFFSELKNVDAGLAEELQPLIDLTNWARSLKPDERSVLAMCNGDRAWQWSNELFPAELLKSLQKRFQDGENLAIRIPVTVRPKRGSPSTSFFDAYFVRNASEIAGHPAFIREQIIVPNVDAPRSRGVRALVVIDDLALAGFLRDAENPSHTEWPHKGSNFDGKYKSGPADLRFIKRTIHEIVSALVETDKKEDPTAFIDFFSLPAAADDPAAIKGKGPKNKVKKDETEADDTKPPDPPPPPPPPPRFRVQRVRGGFPADHFALLASQ
jgi:hypothetical protein